jgi:hypothetical protein
VADSEGGTPELRRLAEAARTKGVMSYDYILACQPERILALLDAAEKYERINTPEIADFLSAVENEALHQRERWSVARDGGKEAADWFWLVGYLAGKALHDVKGKRLHHIITAAAALLNWHAKETGHYAAMRPGIQPPEESHATR